MHANSQGPDIAGAHRSVAAVQQQSWDSRGSLNLQAQFRAGAPWMLITHDALVLK